MYFGSTFLLSKSQHSSKHTERIDRSNNEFIHFTIPLSQEKSLHGNP